MRLSPAITLALTALLVTSTLGAVAADPSASPSTEDERYRSAAQPADVSAQVGVDNHSPPEPAEPRQVLRVELTADGDAEWTVESRYRLESADDAEAFERFAAEVASGDRDVGYDRETFERFAGIAETSTGREMAVVDAAWAEPAVAFENESDSFENGSTAMGVLAFRFTWTNFTRTDGHRIHFGDAFRTDEGTWFEALEPGQRFVVEPPPNYGYEQLPRTPRDGALVWDGPHEFGDEELAVTYLRGANPPGNESEGAETGSSTGSDGTPGGSGEDSLLSSLATGLGVLLLLVVVGAGGYYLARRETTDGPDDGAASAEADGGESTADADSSDDAVVSTYDEDRLEDDTDPAAVESGADEGEPAAAPESDAEESDGDEPDEEIDVELLSDEERVHRLLRNNDGRMKQVSIVSETGWSNAKVSQLLSEMDENDEIKKLRIGRENLITLPDVDPTEID